MCWWPGGVGGSQTSKTPEKLAGELLESPHTLTFPPQEEDISTQSVGEFEVFVDGKLVHSKKVILSKGPGQGGSVVLGFWGGGWGWGDTHVCDLSPLCPER